jgi:Rrf2 family transcriptional regulator, cysteine metabolism repressor
MLNLARHQESGPLFMQAIAEKEGISRKYLHALLTLLRTAGLVRSVRGAGGGYVLARPPGQISLGEILRVLEGSLSMADCVKDGTVCSHSESCIGIEIWREMSQTLEKLLNSITLQDLIIRQVSKECRTTMYHI